MTEADPSRRADIARMVGGHAGKVVLTFMAPTWVEAKRVFDWARLNLKGRLGFKSWEEVKDLVQA